MARPADHPSPPQRRVERAGQSTGWTHRLGAVALATLMLMLLGALPAAAGAAPPPDDLAGDFTSAETEHFRVFVQANGAMDAAAFVAAYGEAVEVAYDELTALFAMTLQDKIAIYVYSDADAFAAATEDLTLEGRTGLDVAVADAEAADVSVLLPRFAERTPLEAENLLRHATARILVGIASGHNLPEGFTDGIAQYVERPVTPKLARIAALVQGANQRGGLLSWSELNRSQTPAGEPDLIAAESYAMVAFLVDRYGLLAWRDFLAALQEEPDWRAAMRTAYNRSPDEIERQWRDQLPRWTAGGWRLNLVAAFDLQPARDLLADANYTAAKAELEHSQRLFTDLGDDDRLAEVDALMAQGDTGIQAEALMIQTQQALEHHTYDRAQQLLIQARTQYERLPEEQRPVELLETYEQLAQMGVGATVSLEEARRLSHRWGDYPEARAAALSAGTNFARLGDTEMTDEAGGMLADLDARQQRLVLLLLALAALTAAWLALWLWARGRPELDWR